MIFIIQNAKILELLYIIFIKELIRKEELQFMEKDRQSKMSSNRSLENLLVASDKKSQFKQDYQYVIAQFMRQPQKNCQKSFYQRIPYPQLQEMMSLIFEYKNKSSERQKKNITNLITMLQTGGGFADFLVEHHQFNKNCIFRFLHQQNVDINILGVFGQIFITLARNNPLKILKIIQDKDIQNIFIRNLKKCQIFTIIYTAIFCLNPLQSQQLHVFIKFALHGLLRTPFEDQDGECIFPCYCQQIQQSSQNSGQISNEHVQPSTAISTQKMAQLDKKISYRKGKLTNLTHCFFTEQNTLFFTQVIDSCQNLSTMLHEISFNIEAITIQNVNILIDLLIHHNYINQLFQLLKINENTSRNYKHDLTSSILKLIFQIGKLFVLVSNLNRKLKTKNSIRKVKSINIIEEKNQFIKVKKRQSIEKILKANQNQNKKKIKEKVIKYSENNSIKLLQIYEEICECLCYYEQQIKYKKDYIQQSSGLKIQNIGLIRFWILKIHYEILKVIQGTHEQIHNKYKLKSTFPTLFPLIQQCLIANRWNNIVQKLIVQILKLYLTTCYSDFYHTAINIDKPSQGFLGFLIELFRNKYHIYLDSMKFTTQGDRHIIFEISQLISIELHANKDLFWLFGKFPQWKQFMSKDLTEYEKTFNDSNYFDLSMLEPQFKSIKSQKYFQPESPTNSSSSVQQLVELYQNCWILESSKSKHTKLKIKNVIDINQLLIDSGHLSENFRDKNIIK